MQRNDAQSRQWTKTPRSNTRTSLLRVLAVPNVVRSLRQDANQAHNVCDYPQRQCGPMQQPEQEICQRHELRRAEVAADLENDS
jgi:hypothetical protein